MRHCTCAYPDDIDPAALIGCPVHGCACPPAFDGIGREKWPDCPVHSLRDLSPEETPSMRLGRQSIEANARNNGPQCDAGLGRSLYQWGSKAVRWRLSLTVFALGVLIAYWPVPRVDLSPIQHRVTPSPAYEGGTRPLPKPSRQPHPASIYTPKPLR